MAITRESTETLQRLLRSEHAAIETYRQAIERAKPDPRADALQRLANEHREAATVLRQHVIARGGKPETASGPAEGWAEMGPPTFLHPPPWKP